MSKDYIIARLKNALLFLSFITSFSYGQCPTGDVTLSTQAEVDDFVATYPNCDTIDGELFITGAVTDLSALDYLQTIDDALIIRDSQLTTISNFNVLSVVYNTIDIADNMLLESINGFNNLSHLSMLFTIRNNSNLNIIDGFNSASDVFFSFDIAFNPSLQTVSGFSNLQNVGEFLLFNDCPQLTNIPTFNNLNTIGWSVQFYNTGMTDISGFENITLIGGYDPTSGFVFSNNQNLISVSGFCSLERIEYDLLIQDNPLLVDLSGLKNLESVGQFFTIRNNATLATLNGFQSLTEISRPGYEGTETVSIFDNPMLSDCDPLCNVLSSNQIIGTVNLNNNLTGCNSITEINTTNCIPFELLACTSLTGPSDGDINVAIDTNISWEAITGATYYLISIGTTSGGIDIANRLDVGNITNFDLPNDLPGNTEIFVKVIPYSDFGNATCCEEESFTTENITIIECTNLSSPIINDTDVSVSTDISWNLIANATGYIITIGSTSGGTDVVNAFDVGNITSYDLPTDLPYDTTIFVTIIPYNASGQASGCNEESFTTEELASIDCTTLSTPIDNDTDVSVSTDISWNPIANASGYIITIGTTSGGTNLLDAFDVGNITSYDLPIDLSYDTTIFVTITPYNVSGQASGCIEESFITEAGILIQDCTSLISPIDGFMNVSVTANLLWNISEAATGYILNIGTTPSGSEIIDNLDVGNNTNYNPSVDFPEGTEVYVRIIPYNPSGQAIGCLVESFTTENISVSAPSFFTPNNDGHNDKWIVSDLDNEIITISIFDRFGKLIKQLNPSGNGWDGNYNGTIMPTSNYWYLIKKIDGSVKRGNFTLKR